METKGSPNSSPTTLQVNPPNNRNASKLVALKPCSLSDRELLQVFPRNGWIKLHRKLLENPLVKDSRLLQVAVYCLLRACHKQNRILWNGQEIILEPGQLVTGRTRANADLGLKGVMFDRKLKVLQNIGFLNRQMNNRFSIITIINWGKYQTGEEKRTAKRTTDEQQMNTNKNDKKVKEIINYLNARTGKNFSDHSRSTQRLIRARFTEGYTIQDFKLVIDNRIGKWGKDESMLEYLRPSTLFNMTKFENYLVEGRKENQEESVHREKQEQAEKEKGKYVKQAQKELAERSKKCRKPIHRN